MKNRIQFSEKYNELTAHEHRLLDKAAVLVKKFVELSPKISKTNYRTRDAHAKRYADVHGTLKINSVADANFKQIFNDSSYTAVIRISNAAMQVTAGKDVAPAYGFSIKLLKFKDNKEFNLPLVNFPLFPTNSVSKFLKLFIALNSYKISKKQYGILGNFKIPGVLIKLGSTVPDAFKSPVLKNMIKTAFNKDKNPLAFTYHSVGCYRMGDYIVKFMLEPPRDKALSKKLKNKTQREAVNEIFLKNKLVYSLKMQYCRNEELVNDLTKMWPKKKFIEIGKLTIEPESLLNPEKAEVLSYNPFDNPEFLMPVGRMQKTREKIYKVSVDTRRIKI